MRFLSILILLGFISVMFCGFTLSDSGKMHTMASHAGNVLVHHISMYEDISTATFFDIDMTFLVFMSVLSLAITIFFLQLRNLVSLTRRRVPKRQVSIALTYKLKRWISLLEHSPSFA